MNADVSRVYRGRLLTLGQVANRLGIDVMTVRSWVRAEQCPVVTRNRARRVPAEWVDELIAAGWR